MLGMTWVKVLIDAYVKHSLPFVYGVIAHHRVCSNNALLDMEQCLGVL